MLKNLLNQHLLLIKENAKKEEAEELKAKLTEAKAEVTLD